MKKREKRVLAAQQKDDNAWRQSPLWDTTPQTLTSWYRSYYHGNAGDCKTVCGLVIQIAELKGYTIEGRGYELSFK